MKFTKRQLRVVEAMQNDGWIWMAGSHAYLAEVDANGQVQSSPVHVKSFNSLLNEGVIKKDPANERKYILAGG